MDLTRLEGMCTLNLSILACNAPTVEFEIMGVSPPPVSTT